MSDALHVGDLVQFSFEAVAMLPGQTAKPLRLTRITRSNGVAQLQFNDPDLEEEPA